jgi:hypothetical protein
MKNICRLPLLFLGLCLPALAGAQTGANLLVTTDMDCNWKLDGQRMDPLKAHDSKVFPVSPGEHRIRAATTDRVTRIRVEVEVDQGQKTVEIRLKDEHDQELKRRQEETIKKQAEAEAALNLTWTDPDTGLMWAKKDNGSDVDWNQASAYCSNLQLAGHSDWRLPTIEELGGIYDANIRIETVFEFGYAIVSVKGNLKLTGWDWSSSEEKASGRVLVFNYFAKLEGQESSPFDRGWHSILRALCVRRFGE